MSIGEPVFARRNQKGPDMTTTESARENKRAAGPTVRYDELQALDHKVQPCAHFAEFDRLREQDEIHFGDASGNPFWMVSRMATMRDTYQRHEIFSSSAIIPDDPNPVFALIPEMLDAPLHGKWRKLLGPLFSPGAIEAMEPRIRARFAEIMADVAPRGHCDFVADVGLRFPNTIFLEMMGLPIEHADEFQAWETAILHQGATGSPGSQAAMGEVFGYFAEVIADRRRNPRNDIVSNAISWKIDGEPVPDQDLLAFCLLMFMAGLDTVAVQLSYSFLHLATHAEDRERLVAEPALMPTAIEEFLRYYAFVTPSRKVMQDSEIGGCPVRKGDMVFLPLAAANRDPREFEDADKVMIDRKTNRHIAFGAGPHRCLGAHLARLELKVAMEMWHELIPVYRLDDGTHICEHGGQIGLDNLPLRWNS
jgi:cytochrome P450